MGGILRGFVLPVVYRAETGIIVQRRLRYGTPYFYIKASSLSDRLWVQEIDKKLYNVNPKIANEMIPLLG